MGEESLAKVSWPAVSYQNPASAFSPIFSKQLAIHSQTLSHSDEASISSRTLSKDFTALR